MVKINTQINVLSYGKLNIFYLIMFFFSFLCVFNTYNASNKPLCRNLNTDGENKYTNKRFKLWEIEYFLSDYVFFSFLCVFNTFNASNKPLIF